MKLIPARWLKDSLAPKMVVLIYHRVAELDCDPWSLAVTPSHFTEHLEILHRYYQPVPLQQLVSMLRRGELRHRCVAVTFDDGYADNLHTAKPELTRQAVPATFFLPAGFIDNEREFWWDELEKIFLQPGRLPGELSLRLNGQVHSWQFGADADYCQEQVERHRRWRARHPAPTTRHAAYYALWQLFHPLPTQERLATLDELWAWAGITPAARPTHRLLTLEEVKALAQAEQAEIGAHSLTHVALASLPAARQMEEIRQGKTRLEQAIALPVTSFAYPFGKRHDYTAQTAALVQEAGFTCACTNFPGSVVRSTDCFQLPRLFVPDWDGEEFAWQLSKRFHPIWGRV